MDDKKEVLAKKAMELAEKSILTCLKENYNENCGMGAADISKDCGFYRNPPINDGIVQGLLNKLEEEKKVEKCNQENGKGGWKLTNEEYSNMSKDN